MAETPPDRDARVRQSIRDGFGRFRLGKPSPKPASGIGERGRCHIERSHVCLFCIPCQPPRLCYAKLAVLSHMRARAEHRTRAMGNQTGPVFAGEDEGVGFITAAETTLPLPASATQG